MQILEDARLSAEWIVEGARCPEFKWGKCIFVLFLELTISVNASNIPFMDDKPKTQDFYYEVDPGYRIIPANTVMTTTSSFNDIRLDFLVEGFGLPSVVRCKAEPDGKTLTPIEVEPDKKIVRRAQIGILLSLDQALAVAEFVKRQVEIAKAAIVK